MNQLSSKLRKNENNTNISLYQFTQITWKHLEKLLIKFQLEFRQFMNMIDQSSLGLVYAQSDRINQPNAAFSNYLYIWKISH